MTLGPQCWVCRRRRVRCDSGVPECSKCLAKGFECPGYGQAEPLRWRHKLVQSQRPQQSQQLQFTYHRLDDIAPAHVVHETIAYYNATIANDCSAQPLDDSNPYRISLSQWADIELHQRHIYVCFVSLHQAIRQSGLECADLPESGFMTMFYHHQAQAAGLLNTQVQRVQEASDARLSLFRGAFILLCCEIQRSAFGKWKAFLDGAKAILTLASVPPYHPPFALETISLSMLMAVEIFGHSTTSRASLKKSDFLGYNDYFSCFSYHTLSSTCSLVPVPVELLLATAAINLRRSDYADVLTTYSLGFWGFGPSYCGILRFIEAFDPEEWSIQASSTMSMGSVANAGALQGWALLANSFQAAAVLYLVLSDPHGPDERSEDDAAEMHDKASANYAQLISVLHNLFLRRDHNECYHKYVLWPMVMAGVWATSSGDGEEAQFLITNLKKMALELGAFAMREAAHFLGGLWADRSAPHISGDGCLCALDWDKIFRQNPLFIM